MDKRKALHILFKLLGVVLAFGLLYKMLNGSSVDIGEAVRGSVKGYLALVVCTYGVVHVLGALRWRGLLGVQGIGLGVWEALRLNLTGLFFSSVIPGSVSGDVVKLAVVVSRVPGRGAEVATSMMMDRLIGLYALFLVGSLSSLACAFLYPEMFGNPYVVWALVLIWAGAVGMPLGWLLLLYRDKFRLCRLVCRWIAFAWGKLPKKIADFGMKVVGCLESYKGKGVFQAIVLSCVIHFMFGVMIFWIGRAFHEHAMSCTQYVISAQLSNATGIVTVTPGGLGIRDAVTQALLTVFQGQPQEVLPLIPVANSLIALCWALVGGVCFLFLGQKKRQ